MQAKVADKMNYRSVLGDFWGQIMGTPTDYRMSYLTELQNERDAYTAQYAMERSQGKKGSIYDPKHPNADVSKRIEHLSGLSANHACTNSTTGAWICKQ